MRSETHSHAERAARCGIHESHVLEMRVFDLERELDEVTAQRDAARETAQRYEEIIARLSGSKNGTVYVDVV